jgi:natural product biosynthesis luciferase-like monooxygenase protein
MQEADPHEAAAMHEVSAAHELQAMIPPATGPIEDSFPVTPLQHGMLFHAIHTGGSGVDIEQMVGELDEAVDPDALRRAWGIVAARHGILRTRFAWVGRETPVQEVLPAVQTPFVVIDLRGPPANRLEVDDTIRAYLSDDRARGFDLAIAPLWRVALFRLADQQWRIVWTYSHTLLDNAFAFVLNDVELAYEAELSGRVASFEQRRPYREHCVWLTEHLDNTRDAAKAFFRGMLGGFTTPTNLGALARVTTATTVGNGTETFAGYAIRAFRLTRATSDALRDLKSEGIGVSVVVEAAWAMVLAAFNGADDVVFGVTRNCRRSSVDGAEAMVGLFINTLPVRIKIDPSMPLLDWLRSLRVQQTDVRPFEHTALVDALAVSDVARGSTLFETLLVYNDAHIDARMKAYGGRWSARNLELYDQVSFPCSLMGYGDEELHFRIEYDPRRFEGGAMARVAALTKAILEAIARDASVKVGDLPRLSEDDARRLLAEWQETTTPSEGDPCVHRQIEAQVAKTTEKTAVVFRGASLTYGALDARSNQVARKLRGMGVGPGTLVGVFVERSLEMVVGLLGILKAGGAYVPIDTTYPAERVEMMLEDSRALVVVTLARLQGALPPNAAKVIALDTLEDDGDALPFDVKVSGEDLAYVIFTSGSTGRPKGVLVRHRNVTNFFTGMDLAIGPTAGVWLALTSISFDISVLEIFWTLARGFTVVVQEEADPAKRERSEIEAKTRARKMDFSLFYFAAEARERGAGAYRLLLEGAKFADTHDFAAVWTPERHFHAFGGLYPNPAVTSAALAAITQRVALRAGSVVLPLHNPIRCAEEWSVVDNLSNGRVGLSFASGWHAVDFAMMPQNYEDRRRLMIEGIETIRKLWRGEAVAVKSGDGKDVEVKLFPPPVQKEPPIWITASGSPDTFTMAGRMGANILTNLLVMKPEELVRNIALYREAYRAAAHSGDGHVSLMLHTFVGTDIDALRAIVRAPFLEYLRTSTDLINKTRWELTAFAKPSAQRDPTQGARDLGDLEEEELGAIMDHAFERYFATAGLFGTPRSCMAMVDKLKSMGVDEIACLIDFGVPTDEVLESLRHLDDLRMRCNAAEPEDLDFSIAAQVKRHGVTHLQCTPSLAALIASEPGGLEAIGSLEVLLLGGEALPTSLVDRLRPVVRGRILNMYGPTETTIWSTFTEVTSVLGAAITIGKPIANTRVFIVDRHLRATPVGVAGELLIGGDGVALGYLNRPELTRERFIPDTLSPLGVGRLYRTGDVARWRDDGTIEFLGRLDHQIKIRGYRIELGEIESVLSRHLAVREAIVVARAEGGAESRLVAYVLLRGNADVGGANGNIASAEWRTIWDEKYEEIEGAVEVDGMFNTTGYNSSYTSGPIADDEMRAWVEETASRIAGLGPRRVLEIGCGTGLLLFRLAPSCARYVGVDVSATALGQVEAKLGEAELATVVSLRELEGDAIDQLEEERFDTIVLNSVAQYFPDLAYFLRVVEKAFGLLSPGGTMFIGDVRSLPLLPAFHHSVELHKAPAGLVVGELATRVQQRSAQERELVLDPALFLALKKTVPGLTDVDVRLKDDAHDNELTRFRYDVVLRKAGGSGDAPVEAEAVDAPAVCTIESLRELLRGEPRAVRIVGVPNARVRDQVRAVDLLARRVGGETAGELRSTVQALPAKGLDPSAVLDLDPAYEVATTWSLAWVDRFDVVARHRAKGPRALVVAPLASNVERPWSSYANVPAHTVERGALAADLRAYLRGRLPDYMVPSAFVVLEAFPLTPNGKVDRKALPAPDRGRTESTTAYAAPNNEVELLIAAIWQDMLSMDRVGVDSNFFDLGANSLMMVQANGRLRAALGKSVSLVDQFRFPTVRALAAHVVDGGGGTAEVLKESQERAQTRMDAMGRRRERREGARPKE